MMKHMFATTTSYSSHSLVDDDDKLQATSLRGFTLVETLVSMFIFVLVIATVSQIFVSAFSGYRYEKSVQTDLETAQFAMNTIAKELRTASIVAPSSASTVTSVRFFDYSQNKCLGYRINGGGLEMAQSGTITLTTPNDTPADAINACTISSLSPYSVIASGIKGGSFSIIPSNKDTKVVGRVTFSLQIGTGLTLHQANIQTSVSSRDYANSGI